MSQGRTGSASSGSAAPPVGASQAAQHLTSEVKGLASDVAYQAKHVASDAVDQVRHMAESQLTSGKERVADEIGTVAQALRSTADQLRNQNRSGVTEYVSGAADRIESASRYLNSRDLNQVVSDVERFARREPLIFLGGTFAIGLMLGRFLKASSPPPPAGVRGYLPARGGTSTAYGDQGYGRGYDDRFQQEPYGYQSPSQGYGRRDMSDREASYQGASYQGSGSSGMQRTPGTPYGAGTSSYERGQSSTSGSSTGGVSPAARSGDLSGGVEGAAPRVTQGSPPGAGSSSGTTGGSATQGSGPGAVSGARAPGAAPTANVPGTTTSSTQASTPGASSASSSGSSTPTKPGTGAPGVAGSSGGTGNA